MNLSKSSKIEMVIFAILFMVSMAIFIITETRKTLADAALEINPSLGAQGSSISALIILTLMAFFIATLITLIIGSILLTINHKRGQTLDAVSKWLDDYFLNEKELIEVGFTGKRVVIIKKWSDIDTDLQFNINYFLKKFEDKIDIVDQKFENHRVFITFKIKK